MKEPFATAFSNDLSAAVETAGVSVVTVDARNRYPASGIAYTEDIVLTADHVVTREDDIKVIPLDGVTHRAAILARDPGSDVILLHLGEKVLKPAQTSEEIKFGQIVMALGRPRPQAGFLEVSWGIVSAIHGPARTFRGGMIDEFFRTETTPYPGFSGGPLINTQGQVVGMNTSGLTRGSSLTIPVRVAWHIAETLRQHGSVKRGYLGIRTQAVDVGETSQQALKREQSQGLIVLWLERDGPAERAGLLIGDIIVGVKGQPVGDAEDLSAALGTDTVGKSLPVEILRGGQSKTVQVTIGERQ